MCSSADGKESEYFSRCIKKQKKGRRKGEGEKGKKEAKRKRQGEKEKRRLKEMKIYMEY